MKFYLLVLKYRFWLSIVAVVLAVLLNVTRIAGFWPSFPLYFVGVIGLVSHFIIGPLRLIQEPMEEGNVELVEKLLASIWFPQLLIKPVRSNYYMIKGNIEMTKENFDEAEKHLKQSSSLGTTYTQAEGSTKLQLAMVALRKNDFKQAETYLRAAIRAGLPDKESEAVAYLSMCQIFASKSQFKPAKDFLRKSKDCKPKNKQVLDQIKEIEKSLSRMPSSGGLRY